MIESGAKRVFVSYAHNDGAALALRLHEDLGHLYEVWLDHARLDGAATWSREIEIALKNSGVVLALLSDGSFCSDYCRAEQVVGLRSGKCVIPVLVQHDAQIPSYFHNARSFDLSDSSRYQQEFRLLLRGVAEQQGATIPRPFKQTIVTAPPLSRRYIDRPESLEILQSALRGALFRDRSSVGSPLTVFVGKGGVGKTVLAQALCHDEFFAAAFPDGIFWLRFGSNPEDAARMMWEIGAYLGDASDSYAQLPMAQHRFRTIFREKAALLVCDDVLDAQDAYPFILDGPRCSLLLTTRDNAIAVKLGGRTVSIDTFAQQQALQLLAADSGLSITELPSEASEIAYECGLHPLALSVVAALAKSQGSSRRAWAEILETLREGHLPAIEG